jgi:type I restriction enzyme M protein
MGFAGEGNSDKKFKMEAGLGVHRRFEWGVPPASRGEYAFVQRMLYSLAENGRMATILPHGVLFRGASEGKIRKQMIEMNLLDAVIGLPEGLFYGTGIPACIMVFKKDRKQKDVLFIDASGEENYEKGKNQNELREQDIEKVVATYEQRETIDKVTRQQWMKLKK